MHFGQKYHLTKKNGILAHFIGIKNVLKKYEKQKDPSSRKYEIQKCRHKLSLYENKDLPSE